jgi:twinkle protein
MTREISYHLAAAHSLKLAHIFLEEDVRKTALSFIALDNNIPLAKLRIKPNLISKSQWSESYEKYLGSGRLFFTDHFGSLESDKLIDKCRYFVHACGADFILLDHISMVVSGQDSSNERKDIDMLMTNLAAFVNEADVGVLGIVHLRRPSNGSFTEGREISLSDLRGSGGLEQLSWNVVALERNQQDPENKNESQIRLLKNREWGTLGLCDTLLYNQDTGRLLPHTTEEY